MSKLQEEYDDELELDDDELETSDEEIKVIIFKIHVRKMKM